MVAVVEGGQKEQGSANSPVDQRKHGQHESPHDTKLANIEEVHYNEMPQSLIKPSSATGRVEQPHNEMPLSLRPSSATRHVERPLLHDTAHSRPFPKNVHPQHSIGVVPVAMLKELERNARMLRKSAAQASTEAARTQDRLDRLKAAAHAAKRVAHRGSHAEPVRPCLKSPTL